MKMRIIKTGPSVIGCLLAFAVLPARADQLSFSLDLGNTSDPGISGFTGPYATVTVDRTSSTTADITFTSLTKNGNIYLFGDGGSVALNVNGPFTVGDITGANSGTGFTPGPLTQGAPGNEDGFGSFNFTANSFDGYG